MITAAVLLAMLQSTSLPMPAWKERNNPDRPVLPSCALAGGATIADSIQQLPEGVSRELARFFGDKAAMSDTGEPFNSTDVVDGVVPQRRFVRAYQAGRYWVIWYEHGGIGYAVKTIALRQTEASGDRTDFQTLPGTTFTGDLCAATKAMVSGVRSTSPGGRDRRSRALPPVARRAI